MALTRPRAYQIYDIDYKQAVRVVTTTNISLAGGAPDTVDGISLAVNDRVLVTGQNSGNENGIYYVVSVGSGANGDWQRSVDTNATGELLSGTIVMVTEGDIFKDTQWKLTTDDPINVGVTALTFVQNYSANSISAGTSNVVVTSNSAVTISSAGVANVLVVNSSSISVAGNIYPTANVTYDLGNTTNRFKDIWLSNSSIYLGNVALSANSTSLLVNGTTVITETNGEISVTGNIIGNYFIGNGSQLTGLPEQYGNSNVAAYLASGTNSSNIVTTGNISGTYVLGNVAFATGLLATYGNSNVAAYLASGTDSSNIVTTGNISGTYVLGNVAFATGIPATYGNSNVAAYLASGTDSSNIVTTGNVSGGNLSITGNIAGAYFIGNGSQLTGLPEQYGNANVAAFLSNYGSNTISTTGNITSGNLQTTGLISAAGNVTANNLTVTNQIAGTNLSATGTVFSNNGYFTGNIDVLGNINSTNAVVYGNSATFLGDPVTGNNAAYFGASGYTYLGSNIVVQLTGNTNAYSQINFQNINSGTDASTDLVLTADNGNDTNNYIDLGIGSSNYALAGYGAYYPNDGYLLIDGGNLLLNVEDPTKALRVVVGSYDETELKMLVNTDGVSVTGNVAVSKNINVTGNLTVQGNLQYVNVEDLQIQDPVILIGGGANGDPLVTNDGMDRGSFLAYYTTGRGNAFVGWKNTSGNMIIASDVEFSGNNVIQVNNYGTLQTGKIYNGSANADLGNVNTTRVNAVSGYFSGNVDIVGNLNATVGLVYANSGIFLGDAGTGNNAAYFGIPEYTYLGSDIVSQFAGNVNNYSQINFQNISNGAHSSTDFVLTADNGDDSTYYMNMGIAGGNWDGTQDNSLGNALQPNDGYIYNSNGNIIIGAPEALQHVSILVGGFNNNYLAARFHDADTTSTDTDTGTLTVYGGLGASGNVWAANVYTTGNVSATGNIAGSYFTGNGRYLTGIAGGGGTTTFSNTAPVSASAGDVWIQANTAIQYVYFDDGTSNQWAEMEAYQAYNSSTTIVNASQNIDSFTGDGSNVTFTLSTTPSSANAVTVNYNGATLLHESYTVSGANITFGSPPANGYKFDVTTLVSSEGQGIPAAGSNTQIQFNDGGSLGASSNLTFDKATNTLNANTVTANGAPLATTGKAIAMAIVFGF